MKLNLSWVSNNPMLGWLFEALRDVFSMPEMSVDMVVAKPPDAVVAFHLQCRLLHFWYAHLWFNEGFLKDFTHGHIWAENEEIQNFYFPLKRIRTKDSCAHIRAEILNFNHLISKSLLTILATFLGFGPTYMIFEGFYTCSYMGGK